MLDHVIITLLIIVVFIIYSLSHSTVIKTSGGIYDKIIIPFGESRISWRADMSIHAELPYLQTMQGPILFTDSNKAFWFCGEEVRNKNYTNDFSIECNGEIRNFQLFDITLDKSEYKQPEKVAVISDLEGDLSFFITWAKSLGILNSESNWSYGRGHLVILGDMLDRGRNPFDLLWFIFHLERQARVAGGKVHVILGNHEQYSFNKRIKSVEAEHLWAIEQIVPYDKSLEVNTILGKWLRSKNIITRIGNVLYVHGGISQQVLDSNLSLDDLNKLHREHYLYKRSIGETFSLLYGQNSPTQYRGYSYATKSNPLASVALIDETQSTFGVSSIVAGHSKQNEINYKFDGRVLLIDSTLKSDSALVFVDGVPRLEKTNIVRVPFQDHNVTRQFEMNNWNDWYAFLGVFKQLLR